jgi:spore coat polysaccharide biosynthesis predicted glycosyltransferase SpsG/CMP-N-acetylneuraminic acid synthetase
MKKKSLILIMARKGSNDSISRQNIRLVDNKPLIYYIIKTSLKFKKADVVVSTDSDEIKELSLMYGAEVISRPKQLTKNATSVKEICFHALKTLKDKNQNYDSCLVLHPKIPLIELKTIELFFKHLKNNVDTIFGLSNIIESKFVFKTKNLNQIIKLDAINHDIGILNKIVSFKVKNFLNNDGKFIGPFQGIKLSKNETHTLISYHDFGIFEQILSRKKILVRIDSGIKIGMGHVYNMLTILNHFRNDEILIVMQKNQNLGSHKFKENLYNMKFFSTDFELKKIINNFEPDIIFNDILNTTKNYMKNLKKFNSMIVNFEDIGNGRKFANLVFNPIFKERKNLTQEFYGGKYACVRDEFRIWKNTLLRKDVKKILISFGGTDVSNITEKTLLVIEKNNMKNIEFTVILGFGFKYKKKIKQKIRQLRKNNFKIILVEKSDFLAQHIRETDFAIISNGRTVFEIACMTVPILTISVNDREKSHSFVKDEQIGYHMTFEPSSFTKNLSYGIDHLTYYKNRKKYKNNLEKLDLLNGVNNVVKKINSEYELIKNSLN